MTLFTSPFTTSTIRLHPASHVQWSIFKDQVRVIKHSYLCMHEFLSFLHLVRQLHTAIGLLPESSYLDGFAFASHHPDSLCCSSH